MNNRLLNFLFKTGLSGMDVEFICESFPELHELDPETAVLNAKLVVDYGFPIEKMSWLILINPSFLLNNPNELENVLKLFGQNVKDKLLKNPFII